MTDVGSAIVYKWVPYSQRYVVLGLLGLVGLGLPLLLQLGLVGLALWLVSGIALNKGIPNSFTMLNNTCPIHNGT